MVYGPRTRGTPRFDRTGIFLLYRILSSKFRLLLNDVIILSSGRSRVNLVQNSAAGLLCATHNPRLEENDILRAIFVQAHRL